MDDAVNNIIQIAKRPCFQTTPESQGILDNLALMAQVQAVLVKEFPTAKFSAKNGEVFINITESLSRKEEITNKVNNIAKKIDGVRNLQINVVPFDSSLYFL